MSKGIICVIFSAILFGSTTPLIKIFLAEGEISPILLAALFYIGSGLGLSFIILLKKFFSKNSQNNIKISSQDIPWLAGSVISGGIIAPILLMIGISLIPASNASLLLNSESVLTTLIAWVIFKENFDWRILCGMFFIISANILLSIQEFNFGGMPLGSLLVFGSCLCWAIDNNLTRKISANDSFKIAAIKGSIAGIVILIIALAMDNKLPEITKIFQTMMVGFVGYGLALVLFVVALRELGAARIGAYFSIAPICGAALSLIILGEQPLLLFWIALALIMVGIILYFIELYSNK